MFDLRKQLYFQQIMLPGVLMKTMEQSTGSQWGPTPWYDRGRPEV